MIFVFMQPLGKMDGDFPTLLFYN